MTLLTPFAVIAALAIKYFAYRFGFSWLGRHHVSAGILPGRFAALRVALGIAVAIPASSLLDSLHNDYFVYFGVLGAARVLLWLALVAAALRGEAASFVRHVLYALAGTTVSFLTDLPVYLVFTLPGFVHLC